MHITLMKPYLNLLIVFHCIKYEIIAAMVISEPFQTQHPPAEDLVGVYLLWFF